MVQAIPFVATWVAAAGAVGVYAVAAINAILINVALGGFEHKDQDGTTWIAVDG